MKDVIQNLIKSRAVVSLTYNKSHFIKFNEYISRTFTIECSVLLGIMIDIENLYLEHYQNFLVKTNGYFPMKSEYVNGRVGMSYHRQRQAIDKLIEANVIKVRKWDGNVNLFQINHSILSRVLVDGAISDMSNRQAEGSSTEDFNRKFEEMEQLSNMLEQKLVDSPPV